jgi:hypothetical protein
MGWNIPSDYGSRLDDRPFAYPNIRENDAVGTYKYLLFDDHLAAIIMFSAPPVEMGENCRPESNRTTVPDTHVFRVYLIDIDQLCNPHVLPQADPPHPVQKRPQASAPRGEHGDLVDDPVK